MSLFRWFRWDIHLFRIYLVFSIEIKNNNISASEIDRLDEYQIENLGSDRTPADIAEGLNQELGWFKQVVDLLDIEADKRRSEKKISAYQIELIVNSYLRPSIKELGKSLVL